MKKFMKDTLTIGFAIFAVFFGAGNLIFPPWIGQVAGAAWPPAMVGLIITEIALPILAVVAMVMVRFLPYRTKVLLYQQLEYCRAG